MWYYTFRALGLPKDDSEEDLRPLTKLDLYDPESVTVKSIFFLYTMDSFIHNVLNCAAKDFDQGKVDTMGPLACALSKALQWA